MFETDNPNQTWDGVLNGKPCPSDTYAYIATYVFGESQTEETITGGITLIR